jgi:hypothetical protein
LSEHETLELRGDDHVAREAVALGRDEEAGVVKLEAVEGGQQTRPAVERGRPRNTAIFMDDDELKTTALSPPSQRHPLRLGAKHLLLGRNADVPDRDRRRTLATRGRALTTTHPPPTLPRRARASTCLHLSVERGVIHRLSRVRLFQNPRPDTLQAPRVPSPGFLQAHGTAEGARGDWHGVL